MLSKSAFVVIGGLNQIHEIGITSNSARANLVGKPVKNSVSENGWPNPLTENLAEGPRKSNGLDGGEGLIRNTGDARSLDFKRPNCATEIS
jgi:hypothetical protein